MRHPRVAGVIMMACLLVLAGCRPPPMATQTHAGTLQLAGYGGLTPEMFQAHIFNPFTQSTGIPVAWDTVPGGIVAGVQAQQEADNVQWDGAIALLGAEAALLSQLGYLADLPPDIAASGKRVPVANAVLYGFGASIIVCNPKFVARCPTNAAEFFDARGFPGARMFSSFQPTTALAAAMLAAGRPAKDVFPIDMAEARRRLNALRPSIRTFYSSGDEAARLLRMGEVPIAYFWSGVVGKLINGADPEQWRVSWHDAVRFGMYNAMFKRAPNLAQGFTLLRWIEANPAAVATELDSEGNLPAGPSAADSHGKLVTEDDAWYLAHRTEVDDFWSEFLSY